MNLFGNIFSAMDIFQGELSLQFVRLLYKQISVNTAQQSVVFCHSKWLLPKWERPLYAACIDQYRLSLRYRSANQSNSLTHIYVG